MKPHIVRVGDGFCELAFDGCVKVFWMNVAALARYWEQVLHLLVVTAAREREERTRGLFGATPLLPADLVFDCVKR